MATTLRLEQVSDLASLRDDWTPLAERTRNPFLSWEWQSTWWRHYAAGRELLLFRCLDGFGRVVAILALHRAARRPVATVRFLGGGISDRLHPICAEEDRAAAADALRRALTLVGAGVAFAEDMPRGWGALLGGRRWGGVSSPVLRTHAQSFAEYLAGRSGNFRRQFRKRERRLVQEHGIRFRLAGDPDRLERDIETLARLHELRWQGRSNALSGVQLAFHLDFARQALERGWLRLWLLEANGRPAAAWYGFRFGGSEWFYQSGRDPSLGAAADGALLLLHTIRAAIDDGLGEYHFLRGDEAYKARFANGDAPVESVAIARGPLAHAALAAAALARNDKRQLPGPAGRLAGKLDEWSLVTR